ncbi:hypothetical protein [Pseudooceanicola sp. MF1-13]|uniref:hypothetical protein n=1 Tax=Pseudooceanicola sp. MF1-13 TaxID=3379095 RepID=UPI0038911E0D
MLAVVHKDWMAMPSDRQIAILKKLKPEMLCTFVRKIDPLKTDVSVLRWIAARQELDLGTALTLFFNFEPSRLNLLPRDNYPRDLRDYCAVMDVLCQRINCGFYIPIAARRMEDPSLVSEWLRRQDEDQNLGRRGRWVLNGKLLAPMTAQPKTKSYQMRSGQKRNLIQGLFTPLFVAGR